MNCPSLSIGNWFDYLRTTWLPRLYWPRLFSGKRQPIRKQPPVSFRPELTQLEDRLAPGDVLSPTSIVLTAMGAGGGFFVQGLVRDLVGGPNLVGAENISLTEPGARGDIASAAPPHDDTSVVDKFLPPVQVSSSQSGSPEPLPAHQQNVGHYFASLADPLGSAPENTLASPLDDSAPAQPHAGGGGGHKLDDSAGNGGGGGRGGSTAPAVDAEGSADPVRGAMTAAGGSNYLSNSALASALASNSGSPGTLVSSHGVNGPSGGIHRRPAQGAERG